MTNEIRARTRDVTGVFAPEYRDWEDLLHQESQFSYEKRKKIWSNIEYLWNLLIPEFEKTTGIRPPAFSKAMFYWVDFSQANMGCPRAAQHPASGIILLNVNNLDPDSIVGLARDLAHEMAHEISQRKILHGDFEDIPIRSGLTVIRNALTSNVKRSSSQPIVRNYKHEGWAGSPFDEAVVEILSSKMLNQVKNRVPGLESCKVEALEYVGERRVFNALAQNIVLAWNNPELRQYSDFRVLNSRPREGKSWQYRIKKLQSNLGWSDTITHEQVVHVFEQALYQRSGLTKIARLLNSLFGDSAFQELWRRSVHEAADQKRDYSSLWKIFNAPARIWAYRKHNFNIDLPDIKANILETDIPDGVACNTFELSDGTVHGIEELMEQYQRLLDTPHYFETIEAIALRAAVLQDSTSNNYPFPMQMLHVEQVRVKTPTIAAFQKSTDFAFTLLKNILQIADKPDAMYQRQIIDTSILVESFSSRVLKNRQIVRVTQYVTSEGTAWRPFISYFVTWVPA